MKIGDDSADMLCYLGLSQLPGSLKNECLLNQIDRTLDWLEDNETQLKAVNAGYRFALPSLQNDII